ncbi:MAG: type IV conjugative transfer system coupling protein TraD [Gammaproteobacteria bacterium]|nr:type IV conjugative transfer system coupling protein TraD [Gammaproteobacteria bacterium]
MKTYRIEALLRPPEELLSAVTSVSAAVLMLWAPDVLLLTPSVAWASAGLLLVLAIWRFRDGMTVIRYQRGLLRMPRFTMPSATVPVNDRYLYLGRGFAWDRLHTQRLRDARRDARLYLAPGAFWQWARRVEIAWRGKGPALALVAWLVSRDVPWNPVRPYPPIGGKPELHGVGLLDESDIYLPMSERVGHVLVLGTTRVGKSQLAKLLVTQDIRAGGCTIVMDPKGDADLATTTIYEGLRAGRPVYFFHLGYPDVSCRYNAIGHFQRITEVATRLTDPMPSAGNAAAFKEFGWRFVNIIAQALVALAERPTYQLIRRHISNIEPLFVRYARSYLVEHGTDGWEASVVTIERALQDGKGKPRELQGRANGTVALLMYIQRQEIYDPVLDGLITAVRYDRTYFDKIVSSLGPLLEKLTTGRIGELISPNYEDIGDDRPLLDWKTAIRQGATVYIGLDCLSDAVVGGAVGASMFADLTSVAGDFYKHGLDHGLPDIGLPATRMRVRIHGDEFNELVGDQFIPMVNKAGGAGFEIVAYTQTADDILAGIGDQAKAGQIVGNFNTLIMLRVKTQETAEFLTNLVPEVEVDKLTTRTTAQDNPSPETGVDFTSGVMGQVGQEDVAAVAAYDLTQLPKGQAFALLEGGKLTKLRFPLVESDADLPDNFQAVTRDMKARYRTGEDWYDDPWRREAPWAVAA